MTAQRVDSCWTATVEDWWGPEVELKALKRKERRKKKTNKNKATIELAVQSLATSLGLC